MKNIHIVPTDKPTGIFELQNGLHFSIIEKIRYGEFKGFHIYITNSEEIKEGDWVITNGGLRFVTKLNNDKIKSFTDDGTISKQSPSPQCHLEFYKKIILTTDQDLIKDGVQDIDDEFLEWFIKNKSCDSVDVVNDEYVDLEKDEYIDLYKIIIPKEESKQEYQSECICDTECRGFVNVKCKKPKQETLEEAFDKIYNSIDFTEFDFASFKLGAKWQQERSYSEEDMEKSFEAGRSYEELIQSQKANLDWEGKIDYKPKSFKEWFEQFKKK